MKVQYKWHIISRKQKVVYEYLLSHQSEKQNWFEVIYLKLWKSVGLICIQ